MGLTSWTGAKPRKSDVVIAKNYLQAPELDALNRIVTAYLEFAELQAKGRRPMYMRDWISKLDDFLRLSEQEILTHAGKISHEVAVAKAEEEYDKLLEKGPGRISPFFITRMIINEVAGQISINTGAMGPCFAIVTALSPPQ